MKIAMIDDTAVMKAIQDGKRLVCVDFKEEVYNDCASMTIGTLQERIKADCCKFFSVEETADTENE